MSMSLERRALLEIRATLYLGSLNVIFDHAVSLFAYSRTGRLGRLSWPRHSLLSSRTNNLAAWISRMNCL
jgi:hypothetical protein